MSAYEYVRQPENVQEHARCAGIAGTCADVQKCTVLDSTAQVYCKTLDLYVSVSISWLTLDRYFQLAGKSCQLGATTGRSPVIKYVLYFPFHLVDKHPGT